MEVAARAPHGRQPLVENSRDVLGDPALRPHRVAGKPVADLRGESDRRLEKRGQIDRDRRTGGLRGEPEMAKVDLVVFALVEAELARVALLDHLADDPHDLAEMR